ncbi:MAG TPA: M28 family peptidase, partial [Pseudomonadales bacterium]|nr:M28 family peptidase [Pseudomonadales bacterium]
ETAKILKADGHHKNPLLLVITDAEEEGLLGAEAFYDQDPLAKHVGVVLNIEAAGSTGLSQVLRTGGHNARMMSLYHRVAPYPVASSLTDEVFKHMQNDTDFSVAKRHGVPGVDFVFAGEFNHYHSPNDSLDYLDKRSLQHHGDNILPLARALVNSDLKKVTSGPDSVYMQVLGIWLQWPMWFNWMLLALSGLMLAAVFVRRQAWRAGTTQWTGAITVPVLVIIAACVAGVAAFKAVELLAGTLNPWPAVLWPYRLVLFCAPLAGGLGIAFWLYRYVEPGAALIGAWLWWLVLGAWVTAALPGAAGVLLVPLFAAGVCLLAATFVNETWPRTLWVTATLVVTVALTLGAVLQLEQTQGYQLFFVTLPFIALYLVALGPLARESGAAVGLAILVLATLIGIVGAAKSPLYSAFRPQHVDITFVQDTDQQKAWYFMTSRTPLPKRMVDAMRFEKQGEAIFPWSDTVTNNIASAPTTDWLPPEVVVTSDTTQGHSRQLDVQMRMRREGRLMVLLLPDSTKPTRFLVDGIPLTPHKVTRGFSKDRYMIMLTGMGENTVNLQLELGSTAPFTAWVTDGSTQLPATAMPLLDARPPLASPVHQGDEAMLIERVKF